ncbi:MAG: cobyrinic acid a,c-diamide synthase [Curvibacter sp. RIFCSPHIGHO2_12_FULL_63_18]|uniref:MinD/ParA family protein n=1 Tax=Rhodoferax sp. TaxID=50421 RepID=UPI0008D7C829|nr:MinD/ParA family protein [Rhodoferax sp.]OGO93916.1 MAG: cobyrinic acid a,c-diamide synthase [Curvibacter sp. GWA2_63_95]OGP02215.1 MAG: cobyrinic acid a,c-diamide synthase [Curvibacter sp. RIFCSPHIGHO2_12_FULL_63_18]HCX81746.1 cobyrinic acid a,c-diamide synthase [Rhodoferax sp.]
MSDVLNPPESAEGSTGVPLKPLGKVVAVTSGKGGVGKTFVSANLAAALAKRGHRVLVLDADLGLANLDVVLNLYPKVTLHDVFTGKAKLEEAIIRAPGGFSVLLAGSGMVEYSRLTPEVRDDFLRIMSGLVPHYDVVLLDTGAGISDVVLFAVSLASEVLVVATPEPTSLTDAYATIKVLASQQKRSSIRVVINQTARLGDGRAITTQLQQVLDRFVTTESGKPLKLVHMGDIPADPSVRQAIMRRQLLMQTMPGCPAALAIAQLAIKIEETVAPRAA